MLLSEEIRLIRETATILGKAEVSATNLFYANLFRTAPTVRPMFPEDMFAQSAKLWESVVTVVEALDNLDKIAPTLRDLGRRHVSYGAEPAHYDLVAATLIATIGSMSANIWTPEHEAAWKKALASVCATMIAGANELAN